MQASARPFNSSCASCLAPHRQQRSIHAWLPTGKNCMRPQGSKTSGGFLKQLGSAGSDQDFTAIDFFLHVTAQDLLWPHSRLSHSLCSLMSWFLLFSYFWICDSCYTIVY
ncbi:hypothetical protein SORBI_3008G177750 [Sorghum bicolor]|uniref:Uncharacterized protein n=1 Tax=Sorghum bicolor TaxID=4558 RepID=A0A1Z5R7C5_SORBI|nr:hypothetical protein SORBI_3008G177750 [Sorghum bicolor]